MPESEDISRGRSGHNIIHDLLLTTTIDRALYGSTKGKTCIVVYHVVIM